jgi:hypothetical protein
MDPRAEPDGVMLAATTSREHPTCTKACSRVPTPDRTDAGGRSGRRRLDSCARGASTCVERFDSLGTYIDAPSASFSRASVSTPLAPMMLERGERTPPAKAEKDAESLPVSLSGEINAATRCVCLSALALGA